MGNIELLDRVAREILTDRITIKQSLEGGKGMIHMIIWVHECMSVCVCA